MRQHIVLLQAMLQQDRFAAAQPGAGVGTQFCPAGIRIAGAGPDAGGSMALLALHPSDAYRRHLMQGLLGLQQQQQLLA
jgi:delta 1-pyrroline-5-carboxylate dehydrogenase